MGFPSNFEDQWSETDLNIYVYSGMYHMMKPWRNVVKSTSAMADTMREHLTFRADMSLFGTEAWLLKGDLYVVSDLQKGIVYRLVPCKSGLRISWVLHRISSDMYVPTHLQISADVPVDASAHISNAILYLPQYIGKDIHTCCNISARIHLP